MEIVVLSQDQIVSESDLGELFVLHYRAPGSSTLESITDLSTARLVVRNSGRRPIRPDDIISPIVIQVMPPSRLLAADIIRRNPPDLPIDIDIPDSRDRVVLDRSLFNPGDSFEVLLFFTGTSKAPPSASARIAGLHAVSVVDRTQDIPAAQRRFGILGWIVAGSTLFTIVLIFGGMLVFVEERRFLRELESKKDSLLQATSTEDLGAVILAAVDRLPEPDRAKVSNILERSQIEKAGDADRIYDQLRSVMLKELGGARTIIGFSAFLALLGITVMAWLLRLFPWM